MPEKMERALKKAAKKEFGTLDSERARAYVYGPPDEYKRHNEGHEKRHSYRVKHV